MESAVAQSGAFVGETIGMQLIVVPGRGQVSHEGAVGAHGVVTQTIGRSAQ